MKVSISMYSVNSTVQKEKWSVIDFINYAHRISLDGVELLDMYWTDKATEIDEVKTALQQYNLEVSAYDISNDFVKEAEEDRLVEVDKVKEGIRTAKALGTNILRVFCGDLQDGFTYEDAQDWILEGLQACVPLAEQEEVYLAIENHGLLAGQSEQVAEIIRKINSPYVKATFDTGNFLLVHETPEAAFDRLKNEIVHVHFKDFKEKEQGDEGFSFTSTEGAQLIGTIPGDGEVNLKYIVDGLKDVNYDGWLSIEYEGSEDALVANEEAVSRLRHLLK